MKYVVVTRMWAGIGALAIAAGAGLVTAGLFPADPPRFVAPGQVTVKAAGWVSVPQVTAPADRVIEVVDQVGPAQWRVSAAVGWVDSYTSSSMRVVPRCSGKAYLCITVRQGKVPGSPVGRTSGRVITLDTVKANTAKYRKFYGKDAVRTWLIAHELGHVFSLKHTGGRNLMNPTAGTGRLYLTKGQRAHLAGR